MIRIMIVDDDQRLLNSFRRLFLPYRDHYQLEVEINPEAALNRMQNNPVDICISDYLMPDMKGTVLLKKAADSKSAKTTILLSGENIPKDPEMINIDKIITKPYAPGDLLKLIEQLKGKTC